MTTVHWLGAGLSSAPGIRRLAAGARPLTLWNRSVDKARALVSEFDVPVRALDLAALESALQRGDILVSMLPADWHPRLAGLALARSCHFVSSSYLTAEMQALHKAACSANLCLVNEVGLDPGLDHLMAHALRAAYQTSRDFAPDNRLLFRSYCGGFPQVANPFRYKFSWSPLGVLRALRSPARYIEAGRECRVARPWQAISDYRVRLPDGDEIFEAYPNRDSLPFIAQYGFAPEWPVAQFVRGTLRLRGWAAAWADLFAQLDALEAASGEARLREISEQLWRAHAYAAGEADRVVLSVELAAQRNGSTVWHRGYAIDAVGNERGSAMARLVSLPVSLAVEAIADGEVAPGVTAGIEDPERIAHWFATLGDLGEAVAALDYLKP
jgi:saccharopine dehydrogenase (NADP+, L-glutamate forming)